MFNYIIVSDFLLQVSGHSNNYMSRTPEVFIALISARLKKFKTVFLDYYNTWNADTVKNYN